MSKDIVITCMSQSIKKRMGDVLGDPLSRDLALLPNCESGTPIEFGRSKGGTRQKREPSQYQKFIGQCMKAKHVKSFSEAPGIMKACATEWRTQHGKQR